MKPYVILGCDPGATGAWALIDRNTGRVIQLSRLPHVVTKSGTSKKTLIDHAAYCRQIDEWQKEYTIEMAAIEDLHSNPKLKCTINFSFGAEVHSLMMLFTAKQIPFTLVPAATWQKATFPGQGNHDKERSRLRVIQTYPTLADTLSAKNSADLAEAILIADYIRLRQMGELSLEKIAH